MSVQDVFLGGALMLVPIAVMLRIAVKRGAGWEEGKVKGHYAPLYADDASEAP